MKTKTAVATPKRNQKGQYLPGRNARGQWLKGVSGCPPEKRRLVPGHPWRFPPGQSGNPAGTSKRRVEFERLFYEALMGIGNPDEAARLLWESARAKEPWAVQMLLDRIAPKDTKLRLEVSRGQDEVDFSRLTDAELEVMERILERARPVETIEGGASAAQPADVH
ncbi:MAG: hypothetical protein ABSB88_07980 [Bryobacteraceae bacterium]|jgi:hypothetical protein